MGAVQHRHFTVCQLISEMTARILGGGMMHELLFRRLRTLYRVHFSRHTVEKAAIM